MKRNAFWSLAWGFALLGTSLFPVSAGAHSHPFHDNIALISIGLMEEEMPWLAKVRDDILRGVKQPDFDRGFKFWENKKHKHDPSMATENFTESVDRYRMYAADNQVALAQSEGARILAKTFHFFADQSEGEYSRDNTALLVNATGAHPRPLEDRIAQEILANARTDSGFRALVDRMELRYRSKGFDPANAAKIGEILDAAEKELEKAVNAAVGKPADEAKKDIEAAYREYIAKLVAMQNLTIRLFEKKVRPAETPPSTAGQAKCNSAVQEGGDAGGGVTVDLGGFVGKAGFSWEMYNIKDQMDVTVGGVRKTTGCVSGKGTFEIDIPPGAPTAQVEVLPNCERTTGTKWNFTFECPLSSTVTSDGSGSDQNASNATIAAAPTLPAPMGPTGQTISERETNNDIPSANPIGIGATVRGAITVNGDADYYAVDLPLQGELTVAFPSAPANLDMAFRVVAVDGSEVRGWQAAPAPGKPFSAWTDIKSPGKYYLEVRDGYNNASSAAPYTMIATYMPTADSAEPNNELATATPLGWNRTVAASILPIGDADYYRLTAPRQGELTIDFTSAPANLDMAFRVVAVDGSEVRGWQTSPALGKPFSAWADIRSPGDYFIEVRDGWNNARSAAPYVMRARFAATADPAEPNDTLSTATPIAPGQRISASILPIGDADYYRFHVAGPARLRVTFTKSPPNLDMAFRILAVDGREIKGWQTAPQLGAPFSATVPLPAGGEYLMEVRDGWNNARSPDPYEVFIGFE